MSQHYSRRQKSSTEDKEPTPAKHIKKGFSAFQKTVALIGSILSIIVASITITNALKGSSATKPTDKSTTTVVIKEGNKGNNSKTDTSASSAYSDDTDNDSGTVNNTYNDDANTTYSSSSDTTYSYSSDDSQSDSTQNSAATSDDTASSATEATE